MAHPPSIPAPAAPVPDRQDADQPRWPPWYGPVALVTGFAATLFVFAVIGVLASAFGAGIDSGDPTFTLVGTLLQDAVFIATAVFLAAQSARPRLRQFGFRAAPLRLTLKVAGIGFAAYWALSVLYVTLLNLHQEQEVTNDLAVDQSDLRLVLAALLVIVVAPVAEELFFRGFFYRALRTRYGVAFSALVDGVVFGAIHASGSSFSVLPALALLGVILCLVYERTGTLFATIGLHAFNNTVALAAQADHGTGVTVALGAAMVSACALAPPLLARRQARAESP
ncbi:MAG: CPBP family intramembrane metalloprotease [Thermoleophilaceae bacterium]|nr:CPBP family intramembrane metalloprotease [Thermoleophilaceae bacterium]